MKIEWPISRVFLSINWRPPVSPFTQRVRRVRCFPANVLTFSRGNAQTRTILARLRRASCSTGSSHSILRLEKQWKSLSALRRTSGKSASLSRTGMLRGSTVSVGRVMTKLRCTEVHRTTFLIIENRKCMKEQ